MKQKKLLVISQIAAFAALIAAWFLSDRNQELISELEQTRSDNIRLTEQAAAHATSEHIDSLLATGRFREALEQQQALNDTDRIGEASGVSLRMAVIGDLLRQRDRLLRELKAEKTDSSEVSQFAFGDRGANLRKLDSLNFALEKSKLESASLRRRLKEKSFGEFLTFTNEKGTLVYYVGETQNGKANGHGVGIMQTGSRYEGEWKDNKRSGKGAFYWPDGEYYIGQYQNDRRNGEGTYFWPNGEKYVGHWKNDRRSGEGTFYGESEEVVAEGTWKGDKLVEER